VDEVQRLDAAWGRTSLSEAVARYLFKLMAYKDEYEVARLYSDGSFAHQLASQFEGDFQLQFHLAPPLWAKKNAQGEGVKRHFGPVTMVAFKWLARLKGLRGTALDVFGRTEERRTERALIQAYRDTLSEVLAGLTAVQGQADAQARYALALEIASIPEDIRGFGHVKARHIAAARQKWQGLLARWRGTEPAP